MKQGNDIFKGIVNKKIIDFINTYDFSANSVFKNLQDNSLVHPGEYGKYREEAVKNILKCFICPNKTISDGFVINNVNEHSKQLDIIVLDNNYIGLSKETLEKFYPTEFVLSFGEVKSDLKYHDFKEALRKMAENKRIFENRKFFEDQNSIKESKYPITFLICKKFDFDYTEKNLNEKFKNDVYKDIPRKYWHNAILSLEDGMIQYRCDTNSILELVPQAMLEKNKSCAYIYPYYTLPDKRTIEFEIQFLKRNDNDMLNHIITFFSMLSEIDRMYSFNFNINRYLGIEAEGVIDEKLDGLPF